MLSSNIIPKMTKRLFILLIPLLMTAACARVSDGETGSAPIAYGSDADIYQ